MDTKKSKELIEQEYEAKLVNEGIAELKAGKVRDGKEVLEELKQKYGF